MASPRVCSYTHARIFVRGWQGLGFCSLDAALFLEYNLPRLRHAGVRLRLLSSIMLEQGSHVVGGRYHSWKA